MSFINNYIAKNLFFVLIILCSPALKASDSLKVKKIEYFEEGKLVRATFIDSLGRITKQLYINYKTGFYGYAQNELTIAKFNDRGLDSYTTYKLNIYGDSAFFYNKSDLGKLYWVKLSNGRIIQEDRYSLEATNDSVNRMYLIDSLEKSVHAKFMEERVKFDFDKKGNNIKQKSIEYSLISKIVKRKYDDKNRVKRSDYFDIGQGLKRNSIFVYEDKSYSINSETYTNKVLKNKSRTNVILNDKRQEIKYEYYDYELKNGESFREPKLLTTQENIYENDRIVKIIYTDHINNKAKIHELKYEFYN